jgi:putative transposase
MAKFEVPGGWCVQAYRFTLDPNDGQSRALARHFGARRKAYNWTVATLKADIEEWHAKGMETAKPSLRVLRKRWNTVKDEVCVNAETAQVWWPECSKEAYADGIRGAVDAYWNWQSARAGKRAGKRVGFPRFKRKGRDADRVCFTTGAMRVEPDRRHLTLPVIGTIRTHENTRRIERLITKGRARVLAIRCAATVPAWTRACECSSNAPKNRAWLFLIHGWESTWVCAVWRRSPTPTVW